MNNIGLEYYYLSGKDIPLYDYNLGKISQLTLGDFIDHNVDINSFMQPFILNKNIILNKNSEVDKILHDVKDLSFLFLYSQLTNYPIVEELLKYLSMIYKTNKIYVDNKKVSIIVESEVDGQRYVINDDNFSILATVVCEMTGANRAEATKVEPQREMSEIEKEFERRRQKYLQMQQDNKSKKSKDDTK